jgi:hypothetical protein
VEALVVVGVAGGVVLGGVVVVDVPDEVEVAEDPVEVLVEVVVVVAADVPVPVFADVGVAGVVMGAATGFLTTDGLTGRRCSPFGPVAEAAAPKLMVAASAAVAATRRYGRRICRNIPLFVPHESGRWEGNYAMIATSAARLTRGVP